MTAALLVERKAVPCSGGCGRVQQREITFELPGIPEHAPDSVLPVLNEAREQARAWQAQPEMCPDCRERTDAL
jgi:hypothetical protein